MDSVITGTFSQTPTFDFVCPLRDETQSEAGDTEACRESEWPSMRTVAEIRRSQNTGAPQIPDSYYKSFQRAPRQFPSLKVMPCLSERIDRLCSCLRN